MLRLPLGKALPGIGRVALDFTRCTATKAPEKIEVFIDDKQIMVLPGTTVLQVFKAGVLFNNDV